MRNVIIVVLLLVVLSMAQTTIPNGIFSVGNSPAGFCASQTAPTGLNNNVQPFECIDLGGVYFAPSGQKFSQLGGGGGAPGKSCTALKLNSVNSDGTWNMTCTPGWQ